MTVSPIRSVLFRPMVATAISIPAILSIRVVAAVVVVEGARAIRAATDQVVVEVVGVVAQDVPTAQALLQKVRPKLFRLS